VKCTRTEEFVEGKDRRGGWRINVVPVISEIERDPSGSIEEVAQIHPGMNREELARMKKFVHDKDRVASSGNGTCIAVQRFSNCEVGWQSR
jgi:hypothetical protein